MSRYGVGVLHIWALVEDGACKDRGTHSFGHGKRHECGRGRHRRILRCAAGDNIHDLTTSEVCNNLQALLATARQLCDGNRADGRVEVVTVGARHGRVEVVTVGAWSWHGYM